MHRLTYTDDLLIPLAEVKVHLREVIATQDDLIESMIKGATDECESLLHRSVLPATWVWRGDAFPSGPIIIPQPARDIVSVQYWDTNLAQQTLAEATGWTSDVEDDYRAFVFPANGQSWPVTGNRPGAVRVQFEAGWENAAAVPPVVKSWVLLRVGAYFMNREAWTHSQPIHRNDHIDRMLDRWVIPVV